MPRHGDAEMPATFCVFYSIKIRPANGEQTDRDTHSGRRIPAKLMHFIRKLRLFSNIENWIDKGCGRAASGGKVYGTRAAAATAAGTPRRRDREREREMKCIHGLANLQLFNAAAGCENVSCIVNDK